MAEKDLKKAQNDLEIVTKIMQAKDGEINKYMTNCPKNDFEIKSIRRN